MSILYYSRMHLDDHTLELVNCLCARSHKLGHLFLVGSEIGPSFAKDRVPFVAGNHLLNGVCR